MSERRQQALRALSLSEDALRAECVEAFFTAGGPGGQHRNKAATGVRLTHPPTEISVTATERRSQGQNRDEAMARLRRALVLLTHVPKPRRPTRPTRASQERRMTQKKKRGDQKRDRGGRDW